MMNSLSVVQMQLLAKSLCGEEIVQEHNITVLPTAERLIASMHDSTSSNRVAMHTIYPHLMDVS